MRKRISTAARLKTEQRIDHVSAYAGRGWVQGLAIVLLLSFTIMAILAMRTYALSMPLPDKIVDERGNTIATSEQITHGQEIFQSRGLQEYGSVLGHGGYLGPDFTAEYLHLTTEHAIEEYRAQGKQEPAQAVQDEWRQNRYNEDSKTLVWTDQQVKEFHRMVDHYNDYLRTQSGENGMFRDALKTDQEIYDTTAFFGWTAWASAAERPDQNYTYTNNWPGEDNVGNKPTAELLVWSTLSLIALIGGIGIIFLIYGRWSRTIGWHGEEAPILDFRQPDDVHLTPSQKAAGLFFITITVLFFLQMMLGALTEHYRVEPDSFYGVDWIAEILPYTVSRTWHLQLSLLWTAGSFLAGGIFVAPLITKKEPKKQGLLTVILFIAVVVVVLGSMAFEWLSQKGLLPAGSIFSQQWEFLDLPRVFQVAITAGMFLWIFIVYRTMSQTIKGQRKDTMPWLFLFSGLAIPMFYAVGHMASSGTHISVAEFWRFWVVHLWVEDFLELFTTVMVAYLFVLLGVVRERIAIAIIMMDAILYSFGGVIGTLHHLYFSGTPAEQMAFGAFFSAIEVVPLTFLTVEAWGFMQLGARQYTNKTKPFPHRWAVMFLVSVGFWNFLGAGVMGFLINLPIVSYYEIGTALTANHAHGAMMGVYGFLALAFAVFGLRYIIPENKWPEKGLRYSFWALNIGLIWMVFISLLPMGVSQLYESVNTGYYEARTFDFINNPTNSLIEWLRMPGDIIFITGVFPLLLLSFRAIKAYFAKDAKPTTLQLQDPPLYETITEERMNELAAQERAEKTPEQVSPYRSDRRER
ncbi:cbb3-type cytochrome c oxidase subunit I [Rothia sp. LK2588]|uniref:nitric-oxide reductase large subunit n=1 Tax=Rothia sp. LK2588 TaxID=3114369 RepID=UPI0034CFBADF